MRFQYLCSSSSIQIQRYSPASTQFHQNKSDTLASCLLCILSKNLPIPISEFRMCPTINLQYVSPLSAAVYWVETVCWLRGTFKRHLGLKDPLVHCFLPAVSGLVACMCRYPVSFTASTTNLCMQGKTRLMSCSLKSKSLGKCRPKSTDKTTDRFAISRGAKLTWRPFTILKRNRRMKFTDQVWKK